MTEQEWLSAKNPLSLLMHAKRTSPTLRTAAGRRRFRLFAVGCARRLWPALKPGPQRDAVEVADRFADGQGAPTDLWDAWTRAGKSFPETTQTPLMNVLFGVCSAEAWEAVKVWRLTSAANFDAVRGNRSAAEKQFAADIARDVFGNPFRPVAFSPAWRTDTAVSLARTMYESRDFSAMPILADALQDAGCDSADVLDHCRAPGPHVRGCWVCDLVLGKG